MTWWHMVHTPSHGLHGLHMSGTADEHLATLSHILPLRHVGRGVQESRRSPTG